MTLPGFVKSSRLGVANAEVSNAHQFASVVLRLPSGCPVYYQSLVHNVRLGSGPSYASADYGCNGNPADATVGLGQVMREIAVNDTQFSRRNIWDSSAYRFAGNGVPGHIDNYRKQTYYVANEPDLASNLMWSPEQHNCGCWNPSHRRLDAFISGCFPDPGSQFYEAADGLTLFPKDCPTDTNGRRIRPDVLAYVYLRLKRLGESRNEHVVLPPAAHRAMFSLDQYWRTFFDAVHGRGNFYWGVSVGNGCRQSPLQPGESLRVLHTHQYNVPWNSPPPGSGRTVEYPNVNDPEDPMGAVRDGAFNVWRGVEQYNRDYVTNAPRPTPLKPLALDYILSEMGPEHSIGYDGKFARYNKWTGGYHSFLTALTYWNSWLCWLTRRAPYELKLQGWADGSNTLYAMIHDAAREPFVARSPALVEDANRRNQWYFNLDPTNLTTWNIYSYQGAPSIDVDPSREQVKNGASSSDPQGLNYSRYFSCLQATNWAIADGTNFTWYMAPFGACYYVWSRVGPAPVVTTYYTGNSTAYPGWFDDLGEAREHDVRVWVPGGWSTIYIPFIKGFKAYTSFSPYTEYSVRFVKGDGNVRDFGALDLTAFPHTQTYDFNQYDPQRYNNNPPGDNIISSAMLLPLVVKAPYEQYVNLRLRRNNPGTPVWLGRPVVLEGYGCSWAVTH